MLSESSFNYFYQIDPGHTVLNNTLTGALDIVENGIWDLVLEKKFTEIKAGPLSNLVERGYLYDDDSSYIQNNINPNFEKQEIFWSPQFDLEISECDYMWDVKEKDRKIKICQKPVEHWRYKKILASTKKIICPFCYSEEQKKKKKRRRKKL